MLLSPEQKELILNCAITNGFQGYIKGKYQVLHCSPTSELRKFFKNLNFPDILRVYKAELFDVILDFEKYKSEIIQVILDYSAEKYPVEVKAKIKTHPDFSEADENLNSKLLTLYPVIDITGKGKEKFLLINPDTHRPVYDLDLDIYLLRTGQKESDLLCSSDIMNVMPRFNPYSLEPFTKKMHKSLGVEVSHLNTYIPPPWRYITAKPKFEGFIKTLIDHLFPVAEEREDVLDWLHYAITRRNGTIMCLAGPRGTGKSLLMSILSYLVGEDYSEMVNKEILEEKFNSAFKNKRLIIFEEVEVSGSVAVNRLKMLANSRIVLEEKGKDSETIDNFTSMSILLNDISQLKIESQDRRFSVPKVADHDLKTVIPEKQIQDFDDALRGEEIFIEAAEFGEFLLARRPNRSYMYPIRGDYYYFLCTLAMSEWKNYTVQYIAEHGEHNTPLRISKISASFKSKFSSDEGSKGLRFPDRAQTFELFLKDYKHRGDLYIGSIVKEMEGNREMTSIMPNSDFLDYIEAQKTKKYGEVKKETFSGAEEMYALERARRDEQNALEAL